MRTRTRSSLAAALAAGLLTFGLAACEGEGGETEIEGEGIGGEEVEVEEE